MKMKKLLGLGMAAILSLGMVACSSGGEETEAANKLEAVKESGKLVVGLSAEYPPFEFHSTVDGEDKIVGVDADLAAKIAEEIGVEVEFKEMSFDGLIGALNADKIDIILSGMSPTPEREKNVDFSDLYYVGKNIIAVQEGKEDSITSLDQLKGMKIAVQKGSIQEGFVQELGCESIKSLQAIPDVMTELKNGNVDAVVVNDTVGLLSMQEMGGIVQANFKLDSSNSEEGMAAAINKKDDNAEFLEVINKVVNDFKANDFEKSLQNNIDLATQGA